MRAPHLDSGQVAREVNKRIRELCERLDPERAGRIGFVCECGCFGVVPLTTVEYDNLGGPVYAEGHPRAEPSEGPTP